MKKQGSMLIEVVASIMIIMLTTTFIVSASIQNNNILSERILLEEVNRATSNLMNEIKYNISKEEINNMLIGDKVGFEYNTDFSRNLFKGNINDLKTGNDIEIIKVSESGKGIELKIIANVKNEKNEVNIEKNFTKSWWMDKV